MLLLNDQGCSKQKDPNLFHWTSSFPSPLSDFSKCHGYFQLILYYLHHPNFIHLIAYMQLPSTLNLSQDLFNYFYPPPFCSCLASNLLSSTFLSSAFTCLSWLLSELSSFSSTANSFLKFQPCTFHLEPRFSVPLVIPPSVLKCL